MLITPLNDLRNLDGVYRQQNGPIGIYWLRSRFAFISRDQGAENVGRRHKVIARNLPQPRGEINCGNARPGGFPVIAETKYGKDIGVFHRCVSTWRLLLDSLRDRQFERAALEDRHH